ncbi:MAG: hypothetical protein ACOY4U_08895 [Pseudomonadota bacterium]
MAIPAWAVVGWPEVFATVEELEEAVPHMRPLGASLQYDPENPVHRHGQALWGGSIKGCRIGIAWDWAEVKNSVVALRDPTRVISNLILTDSEGRMLDDNSCMLELNGAIHGLPWQEQVLMPAVRASRRLAA